MMDRITKDIEDLDLSEKTHFASLIRNVEDETVGYTNEVTHPTGVEAVLKTIEPYLVEEIALMSAQDMINTFVAYTHPHVS